MVALFFFAVFRSYQNTTLLLRLATQSDYLALSQSEGLYCSLGWQSNLLWTGCAFKETHKQLNSSLLLQEKIQISLKI